jgi:integrase
LDKQFYISSTKFSLQERQTKRGRVYDVYFYIVLKDGTEKQKKLSGFSNKTLAKQAYTDFITENCELIKNNPIRKQKRQEQGKEIITIRDLANAYFSAIKNQIKDATIYEKKKIFELIILKNFGDCQLKHLTKQELYIWQDELWSSKNPKTNDYYSYKYLSKIRTYFSAFLTWCAERYEGFTNCLLTIKKPKRRTPKQEMQFWTRKEFNQFIAVVDDPTYYTLFSVLFYTGRRKGEVLSLSPKDVGSNYIMFNKSLTRKTLDDSTYKITSTKTEKVASTPICEPLRVVLSNYTPKDGQFFFGGDSPLTDNTIRRAFNRYAEIAGVKQIRIHDLRHSFVSMLIHLGANLTVVADLIGDTLAQVTKTYAHLYEEDKQKILSKII